LASSVETDPDKIIVLTFSETNATFTLPSENIELFRKGPYGLYGLYGGYYDKAMNLKQRLNEESSMAPGIRLALDQPGMRTEVIITYFSQICE
jgi:hypothetical protein